MPNSKPSNAPAPAGKKGNGNQGRNAKRKAEHPVEQPAAKGARVRVNEPDIQYRGQQSCRVRHREQLSSALLGSTLFAVQSHFKINPGLAASFPWLSKTAQNWETYKVHKLCYEYISSTSTGEKGHVYLSPNYDATDASPVNEEDVANDVDTVSSNVWDSFTCRLNPAALMGLGPRKFVRNANVLGDKKTFDVGTLSVCTANCDSAEPIGKVYVDYDFEFFTPVQDPDAPARPVGTAYLVMSADTPAAATGLTKYLQNWTKGYDPFDLVIEGAASDTIVLPKGAYRVTARAACKNDAGNSLYPYLRILYRGAQVGKQSVNDIQFIPANGQVQVSCEAIVLSDGVSPLNFSTIAYYTAGSSVWEADNTDVFICLA